MRCLILCAAKTVVFFKMEISFPVSFCRRQDSGLFREQLKHEEDILPARLRPLASCCEASVPLKLQPALHSDSLLVRDLQLHAGQVPVYRSQLLWEPQHLPDVVRKCGIGQSDMSHPSISPVERVLRVVPWIYFICTSLV